MKKIPAAFTLLRKHGFTLIELLVVIAIIAILAAVLSSVANNVINLAKRTKAQNTASQIQTAILSYYSEYSVYPVPSGVSGSDYELEDDDSTTLGSAPSAAEGSLIECLSGMIMPSTGTTTGTTTSAGFTNTRSVPFLTLKPTDVTASGSHQDAPLNPLPYNTGHLYFNIAVDSDYDNILGTGASAVKNMPNFAASPFSTTGGSSTGGVAIWANCSPTGSTTQASWYVHTY